ncbi:hypothetical protein CEXT_747721 [Caerostris extrusa]|uniref:Uncharacterized protein n=1 Tax=Caerostris extrusa TaxID=172846 RepID=A0AAV4T4K1_CAEEX|nr:hypothetical protein CEXT_747721 [Caerostris extrusa]
MHLQQQAKNALCARPTASHCSIVGALGAMSPDNATACATSFHWPKWKRAILALIALRWNCFIAYRARGAEMAVRKKIPIPRNMTPPHRQYSLACYLPRFCSILLIARNPFEIVSLKWRKVQKRVKYLVSGYKGNTL